MFSGCHRGLLDWGLCWSLTGAQQGPGFGPGSLKTPESSVLLWQWRVVVTAVKVFNRRKGVMLVPALQGALHGGREVGDPQGGAPEAGVLQEWNPLCWVPDPQRQQQLLHCEYPAGPSCAPALCPCPGATASPELTGCRGNSKICPKKEFSLRVWSLCCPALANLLVTSSNWALEAALPLQSNSLTAKTHL